MNEIKIKITNPIDTKSVYKKHKVYRVHLGVDNVMIFNNKQDADNYARMVSRNINDFIRTSNIIYADAFTIFRSVWPGMDVRINKMLTGYCEILNHNYSIIYEKDSTAAFPICYEIFKTLQNITTCLEDYLRRKKMYNQLYQINAIKATLNSNSMSIQIIASRLKNNA